MYSTTANQTGLKNSLCQEEFCLKSVLLNEVPLYFAGVRYAQGNMSAVPLRSGFFIRPIYKYLLGKKVALQDVEACDVEFYNSTKYILENDPEPLCLTFSVTREWLGQVRRE